MLTSHGSTPLRQSSSYVASRALPSSRMILIFRLFGLGTVSVLISASFPPVDRIVLGNGCLIDGPINSRVCLCCRASMPVQWFLAYRIRILSHSWIVFGGIFLLSLAQGACGIAGGVLANIISKYVKCWVMNTRLQKLIPSPLALLISKSSLRLQPRG